jgi:osmotically-inducible protein OsmY
MHSHRRRFTTALVLTPMVLSGCVPVVATSMAVGSFAAIDRRTLGTQTDDAEIELRAAGRLPDAIRGARGVSVTSFNRSVLLTGQVPDPAAKAEAERAVRQVNGVKNVFNELEVGPRVSFTTIANDTQLTARVKGAFLEQKVLDSTAVKVVTENGVAYLMGLVTQREGPAYATAASRVSGVRRVVTLFDYISDEDLARIRAR